MTRLLALLLSLLVAAPVWAQTDPSKPPFQTVPILGVSTTNSLVRFGDATNNAIRVNVVAGGAAGGTSSSFGAAFPSAGTAAGVADANGFMASLTLSNSGRLNVTCDNCGGSSFADNSAFTAGVSTVLNVGGVFNDALASVTAANAAAPRITSQRGLHVNLRDEFGSRVGTAALPLRIDPTGSTPQPVSQSGTWTSDTSAATATTAPAKVQVVGGWSANATASAVSACDNYATVSLTAAGNTQVITGTVGQQVRICSIVLVVSSATAVSVIEGSGTLCNTNTAGLIGGAATGNGLNLASNGGLTMGTGLGEIAKAQRTGDNVCLGNSTAAVVAGGIKWTSY